MGDSKWRWFYEICRVFSLFVGCSLNPFGSWRRLPAGIPYLDNVRLVDRDCEACGGSGERWVRSAAYGVEPHLKNGKRHRAPSAVIRSSGNRPSEKKPLPEQGPFLSRNKATDGSGQTTVAGRPQERAVFGPLRASPSGKPVRRWRQAPRKIR